jgi:hypothetical protein
LGIREIFFLGSGQTVINGQNSSAGRRCTARGRAAEPTSVSLGTAGSSSSSGVVAHRRGESAPTARSSVCTPGR